MIALLVWELRELTGGFRRRPRGRKRPGSQAFAGFRGLADRCSFVLAKGPERPEKRLVRRVFRV